MAEITQQEDEFLKIQDFINICINKWKWFVISIAITLFVATLYILSTPPQFYRQASILIKEEGKASNAISGDNSPFSDFAFYSVNTNVNNEIIAISSPATIMEAVKRLGLQTDYTSSRFFKENTLYAGSLPIKATIYNLNNNENCSFKVDARNDNFEIYNLEINGKKVQGEITGKYGDILKTGKISIKIDKSPYYKADIDKTINVTRRTIIDATEKSKKRLSVMLNDDKSTVLNLNYYDTNIERAEDFLNTLINVYNEKWIEDKNKITTSTSSFIDERLAVIEQELGHVDNDISSYKSEHLVPDVGLASNLYMNQANTTSTKILELNNQLAIARYIKNFVSTNTHNDQLLPINMGVGPSIETQILEYNNLQLQQNKLIANSSRSNPLVKDLEQSLNSLRNAIMMSVNNQISSLQTQIQSLRQSEKKSNSKIASNPTQAKYLLSVERQQKVKESLYLYLLQKREENELSQAFTAYNTRIITPPMGGMSPAKPDKKKTLAIALAVGLLIPLILIFIKENFSTTIKGRKDLKRTDIPFLGEIQFCKNKSKRIPYLKNNDNTITKILVSENGHDAINEDFRIVRANLEFINKSKDKILMVTSASPENGKTFITLNLAASFAIKGKKTCVIDLDLRKASLSKFLGQFKEGISKFLLGTNDDWKRIIFTKNIGNFKIDVLPVEIIPPNPTELLYSENLQKLIEELKKEYDTILIDCPPVEIVADTSIIAKNADITLFVIRPGFVKKEFLHTIENYYKERKFNNLAIILNGGDAHSTYRGAYRKEYRYYREN